MGSFKLYNTTLYNQIRDMLCGGVLVSLLLLATGVQGILYTVSVTTHVAEWYDDWYTNDTPYVIFEGEKGSTVEEAINPPISTHWSKSSVKFYYGETKTIT